ncbi:hypothetical protein P2318_02180 [Myxococcaceae bacterium GXIMD 01537]
MDLKSLDRHRVILGWCFIVLGAFGALMGFIALLVLAGSGWASQDTESRNAAILLGALIGGFIIFLSLPGLIAGIGLLKRRYWGKVLALIVGLLNVANVPLGTALCGYIVWFWLQSDSERLFARRGGTPPQLGPPSATRPPELSTPGPRGWPEREQPT